MSGTYEVSTTVTVKADSPAKAVVEASNDIEDRATATMTYTVRRIDVPGRTLIIEVVDAQGELR